MSQTPSEESPHDIENPERIIDEITASLEDLKARFSEGAIHFGQEEERIRIIRPTWEQLGSTDISDPDQARIYASGVHALSAYRDELADFRNMAIPLTDRILQQSPSTGGTIALTSSTSSFLLLVNTPNLASILLEPTQSDNEKILNRLNAIDPALANTYSAIREVLYGTRSDPERAALYLLRQTFDHFFGALAPDDIVRSSSFFKQKKGEKEDLVTRHERLMYAAHTHIQNSYRRNALIASFRHMLNLYDALNNAHTRGTVNPDQARAGLSEMLVLLQEWIRSIDE
jgi:hypothetical protein